MDRGMGDSTLNKTRSVKSEINRPFRRLAIQIRSEFLGPSQDESRTGLRVVLYSHDTMGVGHMRRNLLIANQITRTIEGASILVIAGAKEANTFAQRAGVDCLTLPAFRKKSNGTYTTRNLGISADDILDVRSKTILAAIQSFKPDLFIVDKVPAGAGGELLPTLDWLTRYGDCQCILGLRDILDCPEFAIQDWNRTHCNTVIRNHFDRIWIYGDREVYDAVKEYQFPNDIAQMISYTGYLNTESRLQNLGQLPYEIAVPYVLCTVGGGQDGEILANCFVDAIHQSPRNSVLLTGPYMPKATVNSIRNRAESIPQLKVVEFVDEGDLLIRHASHVVSMGGYNTVSAILSHKKPAIIVPRCEPRKEQLIRADRLAELGLVASLHPDQLNANAIIDWIQNTPSELPAHQPLNMQGLGCISQFISNEISPKTLNGSPANGASNHDRN